jgi:hypothetical protein
VTLSGWNARARIEFGLLLGCLAAWGCGSSSGAPGPAWLARDPAAQRLQLERHLRGFDVAMLEVGHRHIDLYWAGQDANWEAADYELQKLRLAIENGLERRPKRAASAQPFLTGPLMALDAAVAARDPDLFATRFQDLTDGCNACHAREQVAFFEIHPPESRVSPIRHEGALRKE